MFKSAVEHAPAELVEAVATEETKPAVAPNSAVDGITHATFDQVTLNDRPTHES